MPVASDISSVSAPLSLRAVMRAVPMMAHYDSVERFVRLTRQCACSSLPVLDGNRLVGMVSGADVLPLLTPGAGEAGLARPVGDIMRAPLALIHPGMSPDEARAVFDASRLDLMDCLPVVDAAGYCLGVVVYSDLLAAERPVCRPGVVGGMATPFGVYLTDGTHQAGASNLALVASGVVTGVLLLGASALVDGGVQWAARFAPILRGLDTLDTGDAVTPTSPTLALLNFGAKILIYLVFFGLLRASAIAGYHAAEHQTVHALERNEPLVADVVRRMPRPHPRCGTNLMAVGLIQFTLSPLFAGLLRLDVESAFMLAALVNLFAWRGVGTWLQSVFTTRPASARQTLSGIAAGRQLLEAYYSAVPVRPHPLRRIWCMGLLQNLAGLLLVTGSAAGIAWLWTHLLHR